MMPALSWAAGTDSQIGPAGAAPDAQNPGAPAVAERAEQLLKQMGEYVGSADQFTFHAEITFDHVLPSGQKLQYEAAEDVALHRPGGLYVEWSGDLGDRQLWYDGTSVTLFDPSKRFYASDSAPSDIDAMLEKVVDKLGFTPPLSDFLYRDPYQAVRGNVQFGLYLGSTQVNGRSCDALAFVEQDIDWQIWIDTGPQLTPCKLVITYKNQPSQPQFSAVFTDWNFAPRIADSVFKPQLPPGTEKIAFAPVTATASPK
jgi:hypothetical protein